MDLGELADYVRRAVLEYTNEHPGMLPQTPRLWSSTGAIYDDFPWPCGSETMTSGEPPPHDAPGSLKQVGEQLFRGTWRWGIRQQGWRRALLIVVVALAMVGSARLNFLGDDAHTV